MQEGEKMWEALCHMFRLYAARCGGDVYLSASLQQYLSIEYRVSLTDPLAQAPFLFCKSTATYVTLPPHSPLPLVYSLALPRSPMVLYVDAILGCLCHHSCFVRCTLTHPCSPTRPSLKHGAVVFSGETLFVMWIRVGGRESLNRALGGRRGLSRQDEDE
jgi:hypothetical protein